MLHNVGRIGRIVNWTGETPFYRQRRILSAGSQIGAPCLAAFARHGNMSAWLLPANAEVVVRGGRDQRLLPQWALRTATEDAEKTHRSHPDWLPRAGPAEYNPVSKIS